MDFFYVQKPKKRYNIISRKGDELLNEERNQQLQYELIIINNLAPENHLLRKTDKSDTQIEKFGFEVKAVGSDAGYNVSAICKQLFDRGINAAMGSRRVHKNNPRIELKRGFSFCFSLSDLFHSYLVHFCLARIHSVTRSAMILLSRTG